MERQILPYDTSPFRSYTALCDILISLCSNLISLCCNLISLCGNLISLSGDLITLYGNSIFGNLVFRMVLEFIYKIGKYTIH